MFTSTKDETTKFGKERMIDEGNPIPSEAQKAGRHFRDEARDAAEEAKNDLKDAACHAGRHARNMADNALNDVKGIKDTLACQLENKPMQSIAACVAVGFVLGILVRR